MTNAPRFLRAGASPPSAALAAATVLTDLGLGMSKMGRAELVYMYMVVAAAKDRLAKALVAVKAAALRPVERRRRAVVTTKSRRRRVCFFLVVAVVDEEALYVSTYVGSEEWGWVGRHGFAWRRQRHSSAHACDSPYQLSLHPRSAAAAAVVLPNAAAPPGGPSAALVLRAAGLRRLGGGLDKETRARHRREAPDLMVIGMRLAS